MIATCSYVLDAYRLARVGRGVRNMRTFGFGAEPTMALSWPRVMESRPTPCWALGGLTSRALEKNEDICDSTMLTVDERRRREY